MYVRYERDHKNSNEYCRKPILSACLPESSVPHRLFTTNTRHPIEHWHTKTALSRNLHAWMMSLVEFGGQMKKLRRTLAVQPRELHFARMRREGLMSRVKISEMPPKNKTRSRNELRLSLFCWDEHESPLRESSRGCALWYYRTVEYCKCHVGSSFGPSIRESAIPVTRTIAFGSCFGLQVQDLSWFTFRRTTDCQLTTRALVPTS